MQIGRDAYTYEWIDNWATIPDSPAGRENGRTHGVAVTRDGDVIVFHQADPAVLIFDARGKLKHAWGGYPGAHGLTLVEQDGQEQLWLTDQQTRAVHRTTLDGKVLQEIPVPPHDLYRNGAPYVPTWVAVNEKRSGGNGEIWVADGYGSSLVHRFDEKGNHIASLSGHTGAGAFRCPHGIAFSYRHGEPELYIADRGNQRVQVYDAEGGFKRVFGSKTLHSPCMFSFQGDDCLVPQLFARVDLLDKDDQVVAMLGDNGDATQRPGWPNHNRTGHPQWIEPGKFNSPHGGCLAPNGDIYVVEWILGGRITKLQRK